MRLTDPYVLASYYMEQELPGPEFPRTQEALRHVMETRPDEMPWACNLQGLLLLNRGENEPRRSPCCGAASKPTRSCRARCPRST